MSAFSRMPCAGPKASKKLPPTAGPNRRPSQRDVAFRRTALCNCAVPTISWISSCEAGVHKTPANPWITSSAAACHISSVSVRKSTPQPSEAAMKKSIPIWMMRRGSKRSASAAVMKYARKPGWRSAAKDCGWDAAAARSLKGRPSAAKSPAPLAVAPDPLCEIRLLHRSRGHREHGHYAPGVVGDQLVSVQREEEFHRDESGALVPVHERVVRRQPEGVGGGELRGVGLSVGRPIERTRERGVEQARIANAGAAAVVGKLLLVGGEYDRALDPDPLPHFASSRSTARRFFAMRRTCFIWASNCGS